MADITENGVISSTGELDCAVEDSHKLDQVNGTASVNGLTSKDKEVDSENQTVPKNSSGDGEKEPEGKGVEENSKKDENSQGERRMSLRPRSTPKKYNEVLEIEEEKKKPVKSKEKFSPNDPGSLPSRKQSGTVVIQMNSSTPKGTKAPAKNAKATRPPPELIKAPLKQLSSSTSVTVVSKPKDSQSGLVLVNTQSPQNKKLAAVTSVPASVTVSPIPATSRSLSKSSTPNVSSTKQKTQPAPSPSTATSDLYEKLGLSDDSYIVEAPSFVVPYLIEKAGEKDLKKAVAQFADKPKEEKPAEKPAEEDEDVKDKVNDSAEEDSSDSGTKPTASAVEEGKTTTAAPKKEKKEPEEEDYFSGAIGKFFLDIGLSLVQEYVQEDLLRIQKRKISKGKKIRDPTLRVPALEKNLEQTRQKNAPLKIKLRQCDRCNFRTESSLVLAQHWSSPLNVGSGTMAKCVCHYCDFEASETPHVALHIQQDHQLRPTVEAEAAAHQCPLCPFEDSAKGKVSRHMASCQKRFLPQRNLEPPVDWEPPAKIPRLPARGIQAMAAGLTSAAMGLVASGKGGSSAVPFALPSYHLLLPKSAIGNQAAGASAGASPGYRMLSGAQGQAYLQSGSGKGSKNSAAGLSGLKLPAELHVVQNAQSRAGLPFSSKGSSLGRQGSSPASLQSLYPNAITNSQVYQQLLQAQGSGMSIIPSTSSKSGGLASGLKKSSSGISLVPGLVSSKGLTIQSTPSPSGKSRGAQQPSISITPLPRSTSSAAPSAGVKTSGGTPASGKGTQQAATGNKNAISCEICDGVIKDMEQLRHHMQWIHKVKIHPKMIHNRPPLNCQKCQSRFFTDQGLERHLLGSHGLVTSSMQEAANRGQDGGRCPICGKVHQWKLLSHVVKDHGLTLKPAHLSYKCTVCTATFGMYKLFETHVYTAHSVVARKVLDKDKEKDSKSNSSAAPLRINDEITIIPQPAAGDSDQPLCRSCGNGYDPADAKRQVKKLQAAGNLVSQDCEKACPSCLRKAVGRAERQGASVDVIDLSDDEVKNVSLPKSQVTITKVPAATKGEPQEKRARTENITEN